MIVTIATALALGSTGPAFVGSFGGYDEVLDPGARWERFDLVVTNRTPVERSIGACAKDADMTLQTHRETEIGAFAVKLDDANWSFGCDEKPVAAGQSVTIGVFFRTDFRGEFFRRGPREIEVATNVGTFVLKP